MEGIEGTGWFKGSASQGELVIAGTVEASGSHKVNSFISSRMELVSLRSRLGHGGARWSAHFGNG